MALYDLTEAATQLSNLAEKVLRGEEIILVKGSDKFHIVRVEASGVRWPGTGGEGWLAPDSDEPLEAMQDYM